MKLQELLEKYKNKIYYLDFANIELSYYEKDVDLLCCRYGEFYPDIKPLSWLLFCTPFLSLLERVKNPNEILVRTEFDGLISPLGCNEEGLQIRCYGNTYQYHKINLVLLNTDAERIEYIEQFTL